MNSIDRPLSACKTLLLVLSMSPAWAQAAPIVSGNAAGIFARDCARVSCVAIVEPATLGSGINQQEDIFVPTFDLVDGETLLGSAGARVQDLGGLGLPELGVAVTSQRASDALPEGSLVNSQAIALRRFVNAGETPLDLSLRSEFDWSISDYVQEAEGSEFAHGLIVSTVLFETPTGLLELDTSGPGGGFFELGTLFSPSGPSLPGGSDLFSQTLDIFRTVDGPTFLDTSLLTLDPGAGVFAATRLLAVGAFGMGVDAFASLNSFFVDGAGQRLGPESGLRVIRSVPEPEALWLLLVGAGAVLSRPRRLKPLAWAPATWSALTGRRRPGAAPRSGRWRGASRPPGSPPAGAARPAPSAGP